MEEEIRWFRCSCCSKDDKVRRACDKGQVYCSAECAAVARKDQDRPSGKKYRLTSKAREKAKLRQQWCRARARANRAVTQQPGGSPTSVSIPNRPSARSDRNPSTDCDLCTHRARTPREWLEVAGEGLLASLTRKASGLLPRWSAPTCPITDPSDLAQDAVTSMLRCSKPEHLLPITFDQMSGLLFGFLQNHVRNARRKCARRRPSGSP